LGISATAFAAPDQDRMTAKVSVANESNAALQSALPAAFAQVLINVTGNPDIMNQPNVAKRKPDLSSFLQNYTFVRENGPQGNQELFAQITFDKTAVNEFLQQAGQHIVSPQAVRLEILGVNSLQDYLDVVKAIKNLPEIKGVSVMNTSGSTLILTVQTNGGAQNLTQILSTNQNFSVSAADPEAGSADLYYRFVRAA